MAGQVLMGIAKISLAELAQDGGVGTVWEVWGDTLEDSFSWDTADPTKTSINVEEKTKPIKTKVVEGETTITWQMPVIYLEKLVDIVGGSFDAPSKTWGYEGLQSFERSMKVETDAGYDIIFTRVQFGNMLGGNGTFGRNNQLNININGELLAPDKVGEKTMKVVDTN